MRFPSLVCILWLAGAAFLCGQGASFQQREELSYEKRVVLLEEQLAARSEDVKKVLSDVAALKDAIRRAWEDDSLRKRTAESGRNYALSLGGEKEFLQRIFRHTVGLSL